jgi:hypothetical protein
VTTRGVALAAGLLTPAAWLLWAERLDAGWQPVLAAAGLWWLAAVQATWRVWLPVAVTLLALGLALPPRAPRWPAVREPAEPDGVAPAAERAVPAGRPDQPDRASRWVGERLAFARTPAGAAALAAEREAARTGDGGSPESPSAGTVAGSDPAPVPETEAAGENADDAPQPAPETQEPPREPTPAPPRVVAPGSVPAPPRTVWEAFAPLHQEAAGDDADDAAA